MLRLTGRLLLLALVTAVVRALTLAMVAWGSSGWGGGIEFLLTWTVLLTPILAPLGLLELPLLVGLGSGRPRLRTAGGLALGGALWGVLGAALVWTHLGSLGAVGPIGLALVSAAVGALLPVRAELERKPAGILLAAGLAILATATGLLLATDPEGHYNERYAENRLDERDLAEPPPVPGDPETFSDQQVARSLAHTWMRTHPPDRLRWSWEEAVAMEGLLAYGKRTGDPEPRRFAQAWVESHRQEALETPLWADAAAPAATALSLDPEGNEELIARINGYLRDEAPRTREGALSHVGLLLGGVLPPQAWVDSLFMHGVYLNRLANLRGHPDAPWAAEEAERLGRAMVSHLRDPESKLFRHAYVEVGPLALTLPVEPVFWARGNGWAVYFLVDLQLARRARGLSPEPVLLEVLRDMVPVLQRAQDESGLWRTDLLGEASSDNPLETSSSALFACGLARAARAGWLDVDCADLIRRARAGIRSRIRWQQGHPTLLDVSTGTSPGFRRSYRAVPLDENVGHGVGAVLLALSE